MRSVRKTVLPPGCPSREMETGKVAAEPGPFGIKIAAGAEEVEARLTFAGSSLTPGAGAEEEEARLTLGGSGAKPGGRVVEVWKRDTTVTTLAGMGVRGTPPKTRAVAVGTDPIPKPPVARSPGMAGMSGSTTVGTVTGAVEVLGNGVFPNESRKVVRSSLGSGGRGSMILMQVIGTF